MAKPEDFENYKLEMLAETCKDVFERKDKQHVIEDIPPRERSPERRPIREVGSSSSSRPEWLKNALRMMNGYNEKFIINRTLTDSEINKVQSRFGMPLNQVMSMSSDFLTEREIKIIDEQAKKLRKDGVSVALVDPLLSVYYLDLKRWKVGGGLSYVLNSGWNHVVARNRFQVGHVTEIWSFRYGRGKLGFAMSPLREKPKPK